MGPVGRSYRQEQAASRVERGKEIEWAVGTCATLPLIAVGESLAFPGQSLPFMFHAGRWAVPNSSELENEETWTLETGEDYTVRYYRYFAWLVPQPSSRSLLATICEASSCSLDASRPTVAAPTLVLTGRTLAKVASLDLNSMYASIKVEAETVPFVAKPFMLQNLTSIPAFACRAFDTLRMSEQIAIDARPYLSKLLKPPRCTEEINAFTFLLARELPFSLDEQAKILGAGNAFIRLQLMKTLLAQWSDALCCTECGESVGLASNSLLTTDDGSFACYVNAHGIVHDLVTVSTAENFWLEGDPETEHSYFPGYSWTILRCHCYALLGWQFNAVKANLEPASFYGLLRASITTNAILD